MLEMMQMVNIQNLYGISTLGSLKATRAEIQLVIFQTKLN